MHASVMEIEGGSSPKGGTVHASVMEIEGASSHNDGNCDFCGSRSLIIRYWSRSQGRFWHPLISKAFSLPFNSREFKPYQRNENLNKKKLLEDLVSDEHELITSQKLILFCGCEF